MIHSFNINFGTDPPPPPNAPILLRTSEVNKEKVVVEWNISGLAYDAEMYTVHYGTDQNNLNSVSDAVTAFRVELADLEANTKYYYVVKATNSAGTTASTVESFTTTSK